MSFACNLDPAVGDVDLGSPTGLAFAPVVVNTRFDMPVRINTGSAFVGAYDIAIALPATLVEVVSVTKAYSSGLLDYRVTADMLRFSGTVDATTAGGASFELVTVTLRAIQTGSFVVGGTVITLGQSDLAGSPIGGITPRSIVSGQAKQTVNSGTRRRADPALAHSVVRVRPVECSLPICQMSSLTLIACLFHL